MQKNETSKVALVTALGVTLLFLAVGGISYSLGWIGFGGSTTHSAQKPSRPEPSSRLDDEVTLICEVTYSMPIEGLDSPPKVYKELVAAGLDYKNMAGWYQGVFSISESRKGAMTVNGNIALVTRPAMFERFGTMVTGEEFTFDRGSGEFRQSLTVKDGRKVEIIKGFCGKLTKAPF